MYHSSFFKLQTDKSNLEELNHLLQKQTLKKIRTLTVSSQVDYKSVFFFLANVKSFLTRNIEHVIFISFLFVYFLFQLLGHFITFNVKYYYFNW